MELLGQEEGINTGQDMVKVRSRYRSVLILQQTKELSIACELTIYKKRTYHTHTHYSFTCASASCSRSSEVVMASS